MLDKNTFGKTPAAIYLAHHLNAVGSKKLIQKISRFFDGIQRTINELEASNRAQLLSAHVIGAFIVPLQDRARECYSSIEIDNKLAAQLMTNVMMGSIKELARKVTITRHIEQKLVRTIYDQNYTQEKLDDGYSKEFVGEPKMVKYPHRILPISWAQDEITPETLVEKSKAKLKRRGKQNDFY